MPRDGSGGYSPPQNSWNPAINGMGALPNDWMAILNDMAAALQASIASDGQTPITGSLNFGNNRLRNVGAPQGQGDGLRLEQIMKGADIPSAETIAFPIEGSFFEITGTTAIKTITPAFMGRTALVRFTDALTLTNGTNLQLPGGANITTQAGDFAVFLCTDSIKWVCWLYPRVQVDAQVQPAYTDHYGPTAPATTWPGMTWADKTAGKLKRRNDANNAWIIESDLFQKSLTQYNAVAAGSVNARTATLSPPITAYTDQDLYLIRIPAANTSATPTLNLGGGVKTVVKGNNSPLVSGDMVGDCVFQWNTTLNKFVLINPATSAALNALDDELGFTIIYPNGGSAVAPASVSTKTRYFEPNPFPGHRVICLAEIKVGSNWGTLDVHYNGYGILAAQLNGNQIVVTTGNSGIAVSGAPGDTFQLSPFPTPSTVVLTAPCRVLVWKLKGAIV